MIRTVVEPACAFVEAEFSGAEVASRAPVASIETISVGSLARREELKGVQLLRIVRSDGNVAIKLLEPFTWGAVAWAICAGVLQAVGARIFESVMGGRSLSDMLDDAVKRIGTLVRLAIAENEARIIGDRVAWLNLHFRFYLNAPTPDELQMLKANSTLTAEGATSLGLLTAGHLAVCGSLALALFQEAFKLSGAAGDKRNIVMLADHLAARSPP